MAVPFEYHLFLRSLRMRTSILRHSAWSLALPPLRRVGAQTPDRGRC
jgi:hypothetical protein